jgi:hypothetical protein
MNDFKQDIMSTVEKDAKAKAFARLAQLKQKRGGKFKVSEKQFTEELENMWITGELSGTERMLRYIESDTELDTKDLIRGEMHVFLIDLFNILKKRIDIKLAFGIEDLLWGRFTTEKVLASRKFSSDRIDKEFDKFMKDTDEMIYQDTCDALECE